MSWLPLGFALDTLSRHPHVVFRHGDECVLFSRSGNDEYQLAARFPHAIRVKDSGHSHLIFHDQDLAVATTHGLSIFSRDDYLEPRACIPVTEPILGLFPNGDDLGVLVSSGAAVIFRKFHWDTRTWSDGYTWSGSLVSFATTPHLQILLAPPGHAASQETVLWRFDPSLDTWVHLSDFMRAVAGEPALFASTPWRSSPRLNLSIGHIGRAGQGPFYQPIVAYDGGFCFLHIEHGRTQLLSQNAQGQLSIVFGAPGGELIQLLNNHNQGCGEHVTLLVASPSDGFSTVTWDGKDLSTTAISLPPSQSPKKLTLTRWSPGEPEALVSYTPVSQTPEAKIWANILLVHSGPHRETQLGLPDKAQWLTELGCRVTYWDFPGGSNDSAHAQNSLMGHYPSAVLQQSAWAYGLVRPRPLSGEPVIAMGGGVATLILWELLQSSTHIDAVIAIFPWWHIARVTTPDHKLGAYHAALVQPTFAEKKIEDAIINSEKPIAILTTVKGHGDDEAFLARVAKNPLVVVYRLDTASPVIVSDDQQAGYAGCIRDFVEKVAAYYPDRNSSFIST